MSSTPVDRIRKLIGLLPEKDIHLGYKFLDNRDFYSLKELVDSTISKIRMDRRKENPRPEYLKIDLDSLNVLKSEVDVYLMQFDFPSDLEY